MSALTVIKDGVVETIEVQPATVHQPEEYQGISRVSAQIAASAGCDPKCEFLKSCWLLH